MNGQLWQECGVCGTEPCCVDCEKCSRHCSCVTVAPKPATTADEKAAKTAAILQSWGFKVGDMIHCLTHDNPGRAGGALYYNDPAQPEGYVGQMAFVAMTEKGSPVVETIYLNPDGSEKHRTRDYIVSKSAARDYLQSWTLVTGETTPYPGPAPEGVKVYQSSLQRFF